MSDPQIWNKHLSCGDLALLCKPFSTQHMPGAGQSKILKGQKLYSPLTVLLMAEQELPRVPQACPEHAGQIATEAGSLW